MLSENGLDRYTLKKLKFEISKQNIKGYSNLKKDDLIKLIMKYKERFQHLDDGVKRIDKSDPVKNLKDKIAFKEKKLKIKEKEMKELKKPKSKPVPKKETDKQRSERLTRVFNLIAPPVKKFKSKYL